MIDNLKKRLLLLEDDPRVFGMLKLVLPKHNYDVIPFKSSQELLELLDNLRSKNSELPFDIALIDRGTTKSLRADIGGNSLFGGDGVITRLRGLYPEKLLLSMSGYPEISLGADQHIQKPFRTIELIDFIKASEAYRHAHAHVQPHQTFFEHQGD